MSQKNESIRFAEGAYSMLRHDNKLLFPEVPAEDERKDEAIVFFDSQKVINGTIESANLTFHTPLASIRQGMLGVLSEKAKLTDPTFFHTLKRGIKEERMMDISETRFTNGLGTIQVAQLRPSQNGKQLVAFNAHGHQVFLDDDEVSFLENDTKVERVDIEYLETFFKECQTTLRPAAYAAVQQFIAYLRGEHV